MNHLSGSGALHVYPRREQGFWQRQFDDAPTRAQRRFDVTFGIVMPILCLYFDPIVFSSKYVDALYPNVQFYAYTISALEIVALCAWLCGAGRAGCGPALLAGVLLAGAGFSFVIGMVILPYSLHGLILLLGALGFVPFLTALVYLRNSWRAAGTGLRGLAVFAFAFGFCFALLLPAVVHVSVTDEVAAALRDVSRGRELSPARLKVLRAAAAGSGSVVYDELVWAYYEERDPTRRARLARAYAEITVGGDIDRRLSSLLD